jgi:hypothetical protein
VFRSVSGRFVTFEAAIAEALHGLENHPRAYPCMASPGWSNGRVAFGPDRLPSLFDEIERFAGRMDFADACAVVLPRSYNPAFVHTTDFRDFATYGVPFAPPEGAFYA